MTTSLFDFPSREPVIDRRKFLVKSAGGLAAGGLASHSWPAALAAEEKANAIHGPISITDIEVHEITLEYHDYLAYQLNHYYGPNRRTVYIVHTNKEGLIGLGESNGRATPDTINHYIGTNPFEHIGDETSLGLGTAMYDLMGKAAGVPVYKLFGQRFRRWVPVGSWTVSCAPRLMAETVQRYAARGFTWMKFHLSPFENVLDQLDAMQKVAPKGFKILFDITMGGTNDHTPKLLDDIGKFPIAGAFEDPFFERDLDAYVELRARSPLPIFLHHSPLSATFEVLRRAADGYILGHSNLGRTMRRAGLFAAANLPFMCQNVGGQITRSMTTHMQAAFKTGTLSFHADTETWKSDVVNEWVDPTNGLLRVSETPGLGVTLNRSELERLARLELPEHPKWIIKTRYDNGTLMYNIADPKESIFMVRPDGRRLLPMSYAAPLKTDWWDDDGSAEYKEMFQRIERDGVVMVKP